MVGMKCEYSPLIAIPKNNKKKTNVFVQRKEPLTQCSSNARGTNFNSSAQY